MYSSETASTRARLIELFAAGLSAVDGRRATGARLQEAPLDAPFWLCAIGKAAEAMALGAIEAHPSKARGGLVITKPGHADARRLGRSGIEVCFGGHPLPSQGSLEAGRRLLESIGALPPEMPLLFLVSGGASSLVEVPIRGVGLAELQRTGQWLLASGLSIREMNLVRKSLSRIKAGGLLGLLGGRPVRALAISDVPEDEIAVIGSGLLVPEPSLPEQARQLDLPAWLEVWVERGIQDRGKPPTRGPEIELAATLDMAKAAVAAAAARGGHDVITHREPLTGDAAAAGERLARLMMQASPGLHVWGGETTLRLPEAPGRGGRSQHLALAAALALEGHPSCCLLSAGTDGSDGPTEDAGAVVDGLTVARGELAGLDARESLLGADSGTFLEASGDLIRTGPTGTNVTDLVLGLKT